MIDRRTCLYIKSIANNKSFTKAAEELYMSQPSLSRYVRTLEKNLGVDIFNRKKIPLELTPAGNLFMNYIEEFEQLDKKMITELLRISGKTGDYLTIGALHYFGTFFLPKIVPIFASENRMINFDIQEYDAKIIEKALIHGKIDLFLTNLVPESREINYSTIFHDRILLVTNKTHQLEEKYDLLNNSIDNPAYINLSSLKDETFILLYCGQGMRAIADDIFDLHNFYPNSILQTTTVASSLNLVKNGFGFTFFGEKAIKNFSTDTSLAYFTYDKIAYIPMYIAYLKGNKRCPIKGPIIDSFCKCVKSTLNNNSTIKSG